MSSNRWTGEIRPRENWDRWSADWRATALKCLTDEWQTLDEIVKRSRLMKDPSSRWLNRRLAALELMRMHAIGQIEWKAMPRTMYRLKQVNQ